MEGADTELLDVIVPYHSTVAGKSIVDLDLPHDSLIALISRNESFIVPSGGTILQESDTVLIIVNKDTLPAVRAIFEKQQAPDER
jgi:cell volume regulation protein A